MKKFFLLFFLVSGSFVLSAQENSTEIQNSADKLLESNSKVKIGGYGEVHLNTPLNPDELSNSSLDVHRMVMLFGYEFNSRTQFITELEFEHVKEVYVEQAFLQYKINDWMNLRAGLLLTPMGLINQYHEPINFLSVERPLTDKYIVPSTWREIGFGVSGNIIAANLKYQLYLMNGFNSFDGEGKLVGKSGLRGGRQKGAESFMTKPDITGRLDYYGIKNLNIGISAYVGETESSLFNGISNNNQTQLAQADSSIIGVQMLSADLRYSVKGMQLTGQLHFANLNNTSAYNTFTESDLGQQLLGYYLELGYNVLNLINTTDHELIPFVRYENVNTHFAVENIDKDPAFNRNIYTTGLAWKMSSGSIAKIDFQLANTEADKNFNKYINAGIGVTF